LCVELGKQVTFVTALPQIQSQAPAPRLSTLLALSREPEDARITGGTRSLERRLLALNLAGSLARMRPASERSIPPVHAAVA